MLGEKEKPYLQGWAMVENPTDEDWAGVKMALITRSADLLQDGPVQPALRRPARRSSRNCSRRCGRSPIAAGSATDAKAGSRRWTSHAPRPAPQHRRCRRPGGAWLDSAERAADAGRRPERRRVADRPDVLRRRRRTKPDADRKRTRRRLGRGTRPSGSAPARSATRRRPAALGDFFQYAIDHPVSLARQKSAMLPIVGKDVEGQKVSHLQPGRAGQAPAARPAVQEHHRART